MAYPFTEFRFLSPLPRGYSTRVSVAAEGEVVQRCIQTAETIQRILRVFVNASNSGQWQFQQLLYHGLRNEKKSAEGLVSVNYNSRHITVCCGLFYYRVEVLDEDGFVLDTVMIAERLWAVQQHARV
ncbi:acyltransferase, partial [Trypanosoma cruzi]